MPRSPLCARAWRSFRGSQKHGWVSFSLPLPGTPRATTLETTLQLLRCPSASCCVGADVECLTAGGVRVFAVGGGSDDAPSAHLLGKFVPVPCKKIAKKMVFVAGISSFSKLRSRSETAVVFAFMPMQTCFVHFEHSACATLYPTSIPAFTETFATSKHSSS